MDLLNLPKLDKTLFYIFIATTAGNIVGTFFPVYPEWLKVLYGICMYLSVYFLPLPFLVYSFKRLSLKIKVVYYTLFLLGGAAIVRGFFVENSLNGNQFITLIFNPTFAPIFFIIIFSLYNTVKSIKYMVAFITLNIIIVSIFIFFHSIDLKIILVGCMIFPILRWKMRLPIVLFILICIYANMPDANLLGGGARKLLIIIFFFILSFFLTYVLNNKLLVVVFSVIVSISPLILVSSTLSNKNESFFSQLDDLLGSSSNNKSFNTNDSRTFLYQELALDLTSNNAWIFGKSSYSSYSSEYFSKSTELGSDVENRAGIEVTILLYVLRAGVIYTLALIVLLQISIYSAILLSNSKWLKFVALNLNGFFLNSFIGDFTGFDLTAISIWMFAGLCIQKWWLSKSDTEISNLINSVHKRSSKRSILSLSEMPKKIVP